MSVDISGKSLPLHELFERRVHRKRDDVCRSVQTSRDLYE